MSYAPLQLTGRVAFVTGGTSGIGRALALGLAEAGADVVPSSRRREQVDATAAEIEARGRRTVRIASDVTDRPSLEAALAAVLKGLGRVDILVNCAGRTNQVFGRHMLERGYGRIINIASLASHVALLEVTAYVASKAAVAGLTKSLAIEWGPRGVNVNAIAPGVFRTPLNTALLDSPRGQELLLRTPLKRFGKVEELAGAAVFLASEAASFVNGEVLVVDGGFLASGVNQ